jgi:hypothetical protein
MMMKMEVSMGNLWTFLALFVTATVAAGCGSYVIRGGDPHPTALVPSGGPFALQIGGTVRDVQEFSGVRVTDFHGTLARGFYNALGAKATTDPATRPTVLVIDECALEREQVGYVGVLIARVRGRWLAADGVEVGQFAGRAVPRNGLNSDGRRQLEDLVEVMYEQIIADYAAGRSSTNDSRAETRIGGFY